MQLNTKMENAKLAALQSEIDFYKNKLARHELLKSKKQLAVKNNGSSNDVCALSKTDGKVSSQSKILPSNDSNQQVKKVLPNNLRLPLNGLSVSKGTFCRTTISKKTQNPVYKTPNFILKELPGKPVARSALSWKSNNQYKKNAILNKPIGNSLNISKVPKLQSSLKNSISIPSLSVAFNNNLKLSKNTACLQSKMRAIKISKSNSETLSKEILALTEQLKQASKSLSLKNTKFTKPNTDARLFSRSVSSSSLAENCTVKNNLSNVASNQSPLPLHKISSELVMSAFKNHKKDAKNVYTFRATNNSSLCNKKMSKLNPLENVRVKRNIKDLNSLDKLFSLQKATESMPEISMKLMLQKKLQNTQKVLMPAKIVKTPVSCKKKVTKVISSKFKVVNKNSPFRHTLTSGIGGCPKDSNITQEMQFKNRKLTHQRELDCNTFKARTRLLNSKYKVVNKNLSNMKSSFSTFPSPRNLKVEKRIALKKRKSTSECMNKNKKLKAHPNFMLVPKSSPMVLKKQFSNKLNKKNSLTSLSTSKYKVNNEVPNNSWNKVSRDLKLSPSKLFNFSTDVDLLMELAAEKNSRSNSVSKLRSRSVLLKRVYKSKNMLINKNVNSAHIKTAKMIKSKYLTGNKRHLWHKQGKAKNFSNFKHFQGGHKSFQKRNKRNNSKHGTSNFASSYFSRSARKMQYQQKKFAFGTFKKICNPTVFAKSNIRKPSTPLSKTLASRVLQHSINRVLTASVKKKVSKVNKYCMFYNRFGRCNNGTKCAYVHDPSKIAICTRFLRGTCKAENCLFSHEICPGKMAICSFFLSGSCTKTNCPYRHEMLSPGAELCKAFVQGYCPKGKQCKKAHILVCPDYVKGFCSKGNACAFPHPPPKEKKVIEKATEECEIVDTDEFLMESVWRYFQPSSEKTQSARNQGSSNSFVPKRRNLPEQPSFISLSFSDCEF